MSALVVVGGQWGDEGKGKVVDALAGRAEVVARYQGGPNAGHTVRFSGRTFALHQIPSGVLHPGVRCIVGNGVVVDPVRLFEELDMLRDADIEVGDRLRVSDRAHVILALHRAVDAAAEGAEGGTTLGTTLRGVGPAYATKIFRHGLRVCELVRRDGLRDKLEQLVGLSRRLVGGDLPAEACDVERLLDACARHGERMAPYVADTAQLVNRALDDDERVLCEGAQGALLDVDHGTYPYVTSSNPVAGGACTGLGIGPTRIDAVIGVLKAYATRVGEGPFPTEDAGATGAALRERGAEFGTTTGRPRRCGWFDAVAGRYAARVNGFDAVALTKFDVLDAEPEVPVCVRYRIGGEEIDELPADLDRIEAIEPIYEIVPGWQRDTTGARSLEDLPSAARRFVDRIGELLGVPVAVVSTGPERDQVVQPGCAALAEWLPPGR